MSFDKKYLLCALVYAAIGMCLGIYMGASQDHSEHVTHAHILLVGFLVSLAYGLIHKLWLVQPNPRVAAIQFIVHHAAAITMFIGLFLLFGGKMSEQQVGPVLGIASVGVLAGLLLMIYMVVKSGAAKAV